MTKCVSMEIAGRVIGSEYSPYMIAELSANHNGDINNALAIIEMAKRAGADAVKLQTYRPDTITLNCDTEEFQIHGGLWDGRSLYDLYQQAYMPWEWHKPLFEHARKLDITLFSSPFDTTAVDLLEDLNAPAYKIASFEAVDLPLIKYVAATAKPMIISTGMADMEEISEAVEAAYDGGCKSLALLHCVSAYPAQAEDYNLRTMVDMGNRFGVPIGLSDHTIEHTTAISSVALGACIIEKHVTLDRQGGGPDDSFSLEEGELKSLCNEARTAYLALGKVDYGCKSGEQGNVKFRRSIYFVKDMQAGDIVSEEHIRSVRPGYGLAPKYWSSIIGKRVACDVKRGTATHFDLLK